MSRSCRRSYASSTGKGHEVVVEPGAGAAGADPRRAVRGGRRDARRPLGRGRRREGRAADAPRRSASSAPDGVLVGFLAPLTLAADHRGAGGRAGDGVRDGGDPADHPRAVDGRAVLAGERRRLQGGAARAPSTATRFYPMLMTAAGTIPPAKVLVLGAGVAGLQALATARRLGAQTTGYDVRPEVGRAGPVARRQVARPRRSRRPGEGGYARELTDEEQRPAAAGADRRDQGLRRRHHDRARPRPPGAEAGHRRGGRGHEARQRDRRPGRRDRAATAS